MDIQSLEGQKPKRSQPRRWGCLKFLLIPFVLAVACYGGMWLLARFGGEWAMSDQIPLPPASQPIMQSYGPAEGGYIMRHSLYFHTWTPDELSEWFEKEGIELEPVHYVSSIEEGEKYKDLEGEDIQTYLTLPYTTLKTTLLTRLHHMSVRLTSSFLYKVPTCRMIVIYKDRDRAQEQITTYFGVSLPDDISVFTTLTCWPRIE